ncbi:MAG: heme-binding protein [Alcaligenaceae bacterium]|nr:heme-binding protein [Alcaligenaceae bacterium SAGV5]MPS54705.1 heme-binding protein [Alcaligenaceae bacterium SAGV3]MPT59809.1 heme-binding protein [Alcaligenaceae bacterium]
MMISLRQASGIVDAVLEEGRRLNGAPLTAVVLDAGGHVVASKREDGGSLLRPQIAFAKAWGALGMGVGSRSLAERAVRVPAFFSALNAVSEGRFVPVPGGVLIRDVGGRLLGAVGVSGDGPDHDEACAVHAVESCGLVAQPG